MQNAKNEKRIKITFERINVSHNIKTFVIAFYNFKNVSIKFVCYQSSSANLLARSVNTYVFNAIILDTSDLLQNLDIGSLL